MFYLPSTPPSKSPSTPPSPFSPRIPSRRSVSNISGLSGASARLVLPLEVVSVASDRRDRSTTHVHSITKRQEFICGRNSKDCIDHMMTEFNTS
ncbi:hypothetical protein NPIL_607351 [Nephila pilipes]|uniref:Uncharacterized protein n=1 Tax=Nephila pilipes TaxID=299642 RepID=A0A8X6NU29_NEPPI|nr:hypothetical protein NPIL_607351 [Nephila pilipes]